MMDSYLIRPGEMLYLLKVAGISIPPTMTADEFGVFAGTPSPAPSADAEAKQALINALAAPEIVVRVWRMESDTGPDMVWYYWDGISAVGLRKKEGGDFELFTLDDLDALRLAVKNVLTLKPVPKEEDFYAILSREDFMEARDLADVWDEVPALDILEADGLHKSSAKELFDAASAPEWRTQVNLTGIRPQGNIERVVRVAQGANSAWMAVPLDPQISRVRVETIQAGELESLLWEYWDEVGG
ncbi:MAG: hypothetical protein ACK2U0_03535 [Candidatus Promineifilaceae bacterium]|jgi:hypothetical protein